MKMLTVLLGAAAGVAATISVGGGVAAAAPDVVGQTYNDAKQTIQAQSSAVIIATRTGGLAETENASSRTRGTSRVSPSPGRHSGRTRSGLR